MLSNLKVLVVILAIALPVTWLAAAAFVQQAGEIRRWRWALVLVTVAALFSPSIWIYSFLLFILMAGFLAPPGDRAERAAALWALLLLAVPNVGVYLQGFGGISNFFEMNHLRALTFALLVPVLFMGTRQPRPPGPLGVASDWCVFGYFAVQAAVILPFATKTDLIRQGFLLAIDTLLPYWVFSRAIGTREGLRNVMLAYLLMAMVLAPLAMFESVRRWPLYDAVLSAWNVDWDLAIFLERAGLLRAKASAGHSLVLGFVLVMAIGFWIGLRAEVSKRWMVMLGHLTLAGGLLASLARGSWVATVVLIVLTAMMSRGAIKGLIMAAAGAALAVAVATQVPAMQPFVDMLPFIGQVDAENVTYRQRLVEISMGLVAQSPWMGVPGYMNYMEELRQGQGIIDIVNSYIAVLLNTGVIGLAMFLGMFLTMLWPLWKLRGRVDEEPEGARLAVSLIATTLSIMVVIFTASNISVMPSLLHMLVGLGVTCARVYTPRSSAQPLQAAMVLRRQ